LSTVFIAKQPKLQSAIFHQSPKERGEGDTGDWREAERPRERLGEGTSFPVLSVGFGSADDTEETRWGM